MTETMFLITESNELREMQPKGYETEDVLQTLIAQFPRLLAGSSDDAEGAEWLLICREIGVPDKENSSCRWALDHLFLDSDGIPVLVEVKRSTDTRIRREVVGQMLDYAANAVAYWPIEHVQSSYVAECQRLGVTPEENIEKFLGGRIDEEAFWTKVKTNLQAGRIRMLFVADHIPKELKRIIEFLNVQMDPAEVLGVEIRQFTDGRLRTIAPVLYGRTSGAESRKKPVSASSEQYREEIQAVADAFNELAAGRFVTSGKAARFRHIMLPEFPPQLHYEFLHSGNDGVAAELHIEKKELKPLSSVLRTFAQEVPRIRGGRVEFDQSWMNHRGRLRVFPSDKSPRGIAETMLALIDKTRPKMTEEITLLNYEVGSAPEPPITAE